ncbi:hypothetical protein LguiB_027830 [Lonicera macranthoides]
MNRQKKVMQMNIKLQQKANTKSTMAVINPKLWRIKPKCEIFYGSLSRNSNEGTKKKVLDEEYDMDLAYVLMMFPSVYDESLSNVYKANNGDLEVIVDMLSEFKGVGDQQQGKVELEHDKQVLRQGFEKPVIANKVSNMAAVELDKFERNTEIICGGEQGISKVAMEDFVRVDEFDFHLNHQPGSFFIELKMIELKHGLKFYEFRLSKKTKKGKHNILVNSWPGGSNSF